MRWKKPPQHRKKPTAGHLGPRRSVRGSRDHMRQLEQSSRKTTHNETNTQNSQNQTYQVVALKRGRRSSRCASAHPLPVAETTTKRKRECQVPPTGRAMVHIRRTTYEVQVHGRTNTKRDGGGAPTLRQTCRWPKPLAQGAFKTSMVHGILQFTLRIAFRCVLHRYGSLDIRC